MIWLAGVDDATRFDQQQFHCGNFDIG